MEGFELRFCFAVFLIFITSSLNLSATVKRWMPEGGAPDEAPSHVVPGTELRSAV